MSTPLSSLSTLSQSTESPCWPPVNDDTASIPTLPLYRLCGRCGLPAPVYHASVADMTDPLGYKMWRLRIATRCPSCGGCSTYRMGGHVVENGNYVKANANCEPQCSGIDIIDEAINEARHQIINGRLVATSTQNKKDSLINHT